MDFEKCTLVGKRDYGDFMFYVMSHVNCETHMMFRRCAFCDVLFYEEAYTNHLIKRNDCYICPEKFTYVLK